MTMKNIRERERERERESTDSFLHGNHPRNHVDRAANKKKEGIYWLCKVTIKFKNKNKNKNLTTDNIDLMCAHAYVLFPCNTIN